MTVLHLHSEPLKEEWIDAYGHLSEAYYLVPFNSATWILQDHFKIGVDYFERTGGAIYTVESHIRYLKEVGFPATVEIDSMILDCDGKRFRFAHVMRVDGVERATFECMTLHFDTRTGRTSPMPDDIAKALRAARITPRPDWAGRAISMPGKIG